MKNLALLVLVGCGSSPPPPALERDPVVSVAAGREESCALTAAGRLLCWGKHSLSGARDISETADHGPLPRLAQISINASHSLALTRSGEVYGWGEAPFGELGRAVGSFKKVEPLPVPGTGGYLQVAAGDAHSCGIDGSWQGRCWGGNQSEELGHAFDSDGDTSCGFIDAPCNPQPRATQMREPLLQIAAGLGVTCVLAANHQASCWGDNAFHLLGLSDGTSTTPLPQPVRVGGQPLGGIDKLVLVDSHACAVTASQGVWCWGNGIAGQLGKNPADLLPTPYLSEPIQFGGFSDATDAAGALDHTCVVRGGQVWCAGANGYGETGGGFTGGPACSGWCVADPVQVLGPGGVGLLSDVVQVTAGWNTSCALTRAGDVYCWGKNDDNLLGHARGDGDMVCDRSSFCSPHPVKVKGLP